MSRASNRIDGVMYDAWKGRFNGSVDLEQEEADAAAMGELGVAVICYKITDVGSKLSKDGVLTRIPVFTVTEARVVDEDLKRVLVERLGLYAADAALPPPIKIVPGERTEAQREAKGLGLVAPNIGLEVPSDFAGSVSLDSETGEFIVSDQPVDDEPRDLEAYDIEAERAAWAASQAPVEETAVADEEIEVLSGDGTMVVGHISDMNRGLAPERGAIDGPRITPFRMPGQEWPEEPVNRPTLVNTGDNLVGQIKPTKDSALAAFLAE